MYNVHSLPLHFYNIISVLTTKFDQNILKMEKKNNEITVVMFYGCDNKCFPFYPFFFLLINHIRTGGGGVETNPPPSSSSFPLF